MAEQKSKISNTFRFKSFADRIGEIDLRRLALYHIGHENEELPEDNETFFHQTLKKWMVLNLTDEYSLLARKVQNIVTLPQLLHKKDYVVDLLLEKLAYATNLSLQPLLELLYVLARDLREDFYPYFQRALDRLVCLLNTQDADQLEWTLVCLAHLFKALKPFLKRNIGVVFNCVLPLLDERQYKEHVTNFAVECFSFIARDVRDYEKFLEFILETIEREQVESVQGCGRLLFEIIRGVKGKFHSTAGDFLEFMFKFIASDKPIRHQQMQLLTDITEYCVLHLLTFIQPQEMPLFWGKLCEATDSCQITAKANHLCRIFLQVVEFKQCRYLAEMDVIVSCLLRLIDKCMKDYSIGMETLRTCTQIVSGILLSGSCLVTQLDTSRLFKKCLCVKDRSIYAAFIKRITFHVQFDIFVLPSLIQHFENYFDKPAFELFIEVIMKKQPLQFNALNQHNWQSMEIKVTSKETLTKMQLLLEKFDLNSLMIEEQIMLLIIAPHLKGLQAESLQKPLNDVIESLISSLMMKKAEQKQLNLLCLLLALYKQLKFLLPKKTVLSLSNILSANMDNLIALETLNQLIANYPIIFKNHQQLYSAMAQVLSHHDHKKRLLAAHSLDIMFKSQEHHTPYHIFYKAELIEPNVHNYRELILLVQKLDIETELFKQFNDSCREDCIKFFLGLLYHNFKFIWDPVLKLIENYYKYVDNNKFWLIYQKKLHSTQEKINYSQQTINEYVLSSYWNCTALNEVVTIQVDQDLNHQQLQNYRNLLWQRLPQFGNLFELKNRELVSMFMTFVDEEYKQQLENKENSWDLSYNNADLIDIEDIAEDNEEEPRMIAAKNSAKKNSRYNTTVQPANVKSILQALQTKLTVFAAHQNPRHLYRERELWSLYTQLLKCGNEQLQKSALDCIFAYKSKALIAYKENFYNILDEKKFKDELINFKIENLPTEHRQELMEILLRLLYGKMITRGTQKGINAQQRKSIILRFLGQCSLEEIQWFLQMALGLYNDFCQESIDIVNVPALVKEKFNIHSVWSPKKLHSVVNLIELIRKEFGGIMAQKFHYYMLKLLIFIGSVCNEVFLLDKSLIHPKMPVVFKNLKQSALQSFDNFFQHIDDFEWTPEVIQCLSEVYIYPGLEKLPLDSIHSPTILLKLLLRFGEKPKHFIFLAQKPPQKKENIFHFIISLLLNESSKPLVRKSIMSLIERLLVASDNDLEHADQGLQLLKPYIPNILQRLKMNFSTKRSKQFLDKRDLNVLSMLTKHVTEPETCDSLLQLLLPILIARTQNQYSTEVITQVITTLSNLIKRLENPEFYIRKLAPLFEQVQEVAARKQLCELIADIARIKNKQNSNSLISQQLKILARIVLLLNAWDKRWVEQPDYEKRLDAFKEIKQQIEKPEGVNIDLGILVIYNCFYFLRYDKDMGLRDNASENLKLLLPHMAKKYALDKINIDYLIGDVFINLIKRVIKDSNENVRNEGVSLLGEMARECPQSHEILQDLHGLGDKIDPEVDFFENLVHLQSHRHGRALLKFNSYAATLNKPLCVKTLTQFILPLASRYLLQEQHASKHTLIDAAIETVGVVCQLLPWSHYHSILRYYLMKMRLTHDFQKQCVRIVVRILDAFHYDLSMAQNDQQILENLKIVIKEKAEETYVEIKDIKQEDHDNIKSNDSGCDDDDGTHDDSRSAKSEAETLEQVLENEDKEEEVEEDPASDVVKLEPCLHRITVLQTNASKKVLTTITTILIPALNRSITDKSSYDNKHKVNRKRLSMEREEEEILRVPIGLALIKLMQKLPKELMDSCLPGVFMKVCTFLRSPLKSVRMLTRDVLKKIMLCLGSKYLPMLMDHLQNLLTRGFQVHVLSVTVHGVLDALRDSLQPCDVEACLHNLLEVALNDIFGEINAEKEVDKFTAHTPEAKPSFKSFIVLHIIARNIRETCLIDLLMPFKDHLAKSKSRKLTVKIQESFGKIVNGLVENSHVSRESLLIFIYGTMSESITDLLPGTDRRILTEKEKEKMRRAKPDCFIIEPEPRMRSGFINKQVKTNAQANAHILIEFGLEMLHIVLKRKKLVDIDYAPFLNPILPLLKDSLRSTYIRVTTFALKCFATLWVEEYNLKNMKELKYIKDVVERIFEILKNFSTFGATKQEDNFQLIKATFKAIVALIRKCDYYNLTEQQIDELILYIEQDLHDSENQAMTFNLLKAMLTRKVESKAIHNVMQIISDMSITSHSDYVRSEARNLLTIYVMEYALNKRIDKIIKFFTVQLCYSLPTGRLSAIEFLLTIIKKFPLSILSKRSELLYLSLGLRLVNDEEAECRKAIANSIEIMITRLEKAGRQRLFDMTLLFFNNENKPSVREMAAALCSRFLNAEKHTFAPRIKLVLPALVGRLTANSTKPGRFVRAPNASYSTEEETNGVKHKNFKKSSKKSDVALEHEINSILKSDQEQEETLARKQKFLDHELIQMQYCLMKIFEYNSKELFKNKDLTNIVDELAYESQRLLGHEHNWVRCNAAKIIRYIISGLDLALIGRKLSQIYSHEDEAKRINIDFIYLNPEYDIKCLVLDLCAQMIPGETAQIMVDETMNIFLYIATMLRDVPFKIKREIELTTDVQVDRDETLTKINLNWLMKNIRFLINKEVSKAPHSTTMRSALFTLIEALITLLPVETLELLGPSLLSTLVREMSEEDQNIDAELRQLALRVGSRLRKRIGSDVYDKLRATAQMKLMVRRAERKKVIAVEKIQDPVRAAKRKFAVQERKKSAKKLKASVLRGKAVDVKQKLKKRKRKAEEDLF